jgi:two-component system chemotaxis sensor kinase CheA
VHSDIDDLGLLGSAVIGDRVTELLDVRAAILAADPAFYSPALGSVPAGLGIDTSAFGFEGTDSPLMEV